MDKRAYYQKYYKVIRLTGYLLLLIFYPVFYALAADQIEGYGWSDEEHIVIGTEAKDIMVFDENGTLMRIFSVENIADNYSMYLQDGIYIFPNRSDNAYVYEPDGTLRESGKQDIYWERLNIKSRSATLEAARRQNRTNLEYSSFLGMKKVALHRNGEEKILFQTDTTAFIIKLFGGYAVVLGGFGVICGVIKRTYLEQE